MPTQCLRSTSLTGPTLLDTSAPGSGGCGAGSAGSAPDRPSAALAAAVPADNAAISWRWTTTSA